MSLERGSHSCYDLKYHFVWCPKYRRFAIDDNVCNYIRGLINEISERYDYEVMEMAVMRDHVHIFLSASPDVSPSEIAQTIKSITAKKVFKRFPGIKKILWGGALWERGYFVMSSGTDTTDEMIKKYIKEQRKEDTNDQPNLFG